MRFLTKEFGIPEIHVFSSKLRTFKEGISRHTNGQGVDVVLNSLSGQFLQDSLACVSRFGTFVEIGKTDIHMGSRLSMTPFDPNITFASVDLSLVQEHRPAKLGQLVQKAVSLISEGTLRRALFEDTGGMYPELLTRPDLKTYLPPIGGLTGASPVPLPAMVC